MKRLRFVCLLVVATAAAISARAAALLDEPKSLKLALPDERLTVNGLGWWPEEKPGLARLPQRLKSAMPPKVWNLAQAPAGVRLRFATDSDRIALAATSPSTSTPVHVTAIGNAGVDLYVDGVYVGSAAPDAKGKLEKEWVIGKTRARREITFYLPYGRPLKIDTVALPADAKVWPAKAFVVAKPVVYYGSSITQGIAASNPGLIYQAQLARWLDADFVNLGFSGNGFGEPALAHAVAEVDAACIVVDYWANPPAQLYRDTLPGFIDILRARHPTTPIIVTGPYYNPSEDVPGDAGQRQIEKRAFAREFVEKRRVAGDKYIVHVDGLEMLSREQADGLVDARHANSLGFYYCARGLEPYLRTALGLPPGKPRP
ncbi:MAG TPA: SGNH/GDSL hydrolase family protein [Opitutaceae bacterium]